MLCFRCEHRAKSLEAALQGKKYSPRYECAQHNTSSWCCYMYEPCHPVITAPQDPNDDRPRFGPMFIAARERALKVLDKEDGLKLAVLHTHNNQVAVGWAKLKSKRGSK